MIESTTQDSHQINIPTTFHDYKVIKYLGCGSTSVVYLVEEVNTRVLFSAKIISKKYAEDKKMIKAIQNEVKILNMIDHPNIIKIQDFFEMKNKYEEEYYVFITEYCQNGDLISYVINHGFNSETEKKKIVLKILEAIKYLHQKGISHGDIKTENILLDKDLSPKLCDFGYSKTTKIAGDEGKRGTLYYAAPELFTKGEFDTFKADIYAIGVTLYSMTEKEFPYESDDQKQIVQQILNGKLTIKKETDPLLKRLFEKCTVLNPQNRPSIDDIIHDAYFISDYKNNNLCQKKINSYKNIDEISIHFFEI